MRTYASTKKRTVGDYFRTFPHRAQKNPAEAGHLSAGGGLGDIVVRENAIDSQNVVHWYPKGERRGVLL